MIYSRQEPLRDHHQIENSGLACSGAYYGLPRAVALPSGTGQVAPGGIDSAPSGIFVTRALFDDLQKALQQEDNPIRRLSSYPIDRCFVYLDVSDFSKYPPGQEVLIINSIVGIVEDWQMWNSIFSLHAWQSLEAKSASATATFLCSRTLLPRRTSLHTLRK